MDRSAAPSPGYHFILFVGAPPGSGKLCVTDRFAVFQRVSSRFSGFFSHEGTGFFRGEWEDCLCIEIATVDRLAVVEVAGEIREALNLEAVGLSWNGIYQRIVAESLPDEVLGNWNLPPLATADG